MSTILVVDDNKQFREFICDTLDYAEIQTITASDGATGLQLAEQHAPDLIILDVNMPDLNGFQVLAQLRKLSRTRLTPVIFVTAEKSLPALRKGMLGGAEDYLTKPVSPQDLLAAVQVQLRKRAALAEHHDTTMRMLRKSIIYALPHELLTPLALISGYAHLLESEYLTIEPEQILQYARSISAASSRLERLTENYLIYAQLELIHSDPVAVQQANNHLIKDSSVIIGAAAAEQAATAGRSDDLRLDLQPQAMRLSESNLKKIILELVGNAFKFSKSESPVIVRSFRSEDQLYVVIRDHGRGMTSEQIDLLGAYMQFGRELYEQQGLGLGFAVAKRLVELHGGALKVESQLDKGTQVAIRFSLF